MKNSHQELYKMLRDAYNGMGGYADGTYLRKHERESNEKYTQRRELAYYLNYFKPCVDAHVSPIFKTNAIRDWSGAGATTWEIFLEDVDFKGTTFKDLMKQAAQKAKINGVCFIAVDRAEEMGEMSLASLEENRENIPYAFVIEPVCVNEIVVDKFGRITKFEYLERDAYNEEQPAKRTLTVEGWELHDSKGIHKGSWSLGMVPIIPVPSRNSSDNFNPFPPSEFISIAKTNHAIYNMSSWLSDILINQTFSVLVYPSSSTDDLILGTSNALGFPSEASHEPKFIAPAAEPANILHAEIDRLQQECYRMSGVVNVTGVKGEQSGVAKAWDFERTNQLLSDFADILESTEKKVANLFQRFTGVEFEYTVNYPNDFSIADVQTELANAEIAKGLAFGDDFNEQVFKRVLTSYLPELSDKEFDEMVKAYEEETERRKLDEQHASQMFNAGTDDEENSEDEDDEKGAGNE